MELIWIVFLKESVDNLRDRRSLFMALIKRRTGLVSQVTSRGARNTGMRAKRCIVD